MEIDASVALDRACRLIEQLGDGLRHLDMSVRYRVEHVETPARVAPGTLSERPHEVRNARQSLLILGTPDIGARQAVRSWTKPDRLGEWP